MAVTLEWVRDNYDNNKNRLIDDDEASLASYDWSHGTITDEQMSMISWAWTTNELLPAYDTPPPSDCPWDLNGDGIVDDADKQWLTDHSGPCTPGSKGDFNGDGVIDIDDLIIIGQHYGPCPGVTPPPPPNMETRTMSLTEGQHQIQVSLSGYNTLNTTINVSSTGVTCTVGPCNTQGPPGVVTSGWTITTYLKTATVTPGKCTWINAQTHDQVFWIQELIKAYFGRTDLGFTVQGNSAYIQSAIKVYFGRGTIASEFGC